MPIPLKDARLCLDCETVFDEPKCPRCDSVGFYPLIRWVQPAIDSEAAAVRASAFKTSLALIGAGAIYGLWMLLKKTDNQER
jgi:hypothetical protein